VLSADDVLAAQETLRRYLSPTPLRRSFALGQLRAYLKLECWQPTGSFKVRGALNQMVALEGSPDAQVVAASAGNHALGVAFATEALGGLTKATLFVPKTAPRSKVRKLRRFSVSVREEGRDYDEAFRAAQAYAQATGATYLHAFDSPKTAAGQGTVGAEILDQLKDVASIVVPVGGGGLAAGIAVVVKSLSPSVRIVAVQPEASPSLRESLKQGKPLLEFPAKPTLADGLAGGIGEIVFAYRGLIDDVATVTEQEIEDAIVTLLEEDQIVAEGAGAVGVAAVRSGRLGKLAEPIAIIVTGGNIDARVLKGLLAARV